jgi:hypothetical protein
MKLLLRRMHQVIAARQSHHVKTRASADRASGLAATATPASGVAAPSASPP